MTPSPSRPSRRQHLRSVVPLAAVSLAAAVLLTACGDDDGDAGGSGGVSEATFCDAVAELENSLDTATPTETQWQQAQEAAGDLKELGVPDSFPEQHRATFAETLTLITKSSPEAYLAELKTWDAETMAGMDAIGDYFKETCAPLQDK